MLYVCGVVGLNASAACAARRYSNAFAFIEAPSLAEYTTTSPTPAVPAAAVTTTWFADCPDSMVADTPHSVTFVISVPLPRLVPLITT